jgi:hypothetical protein
LEQVHILSRKNRRTSAAKAAIEAALAIALEQAKANQATSTDPQLIAASGPTAVTQ